MERVIEAKYIKDYTIELLFNDNIKGKVDLREIIVNDHRKIFKELIDKKKFKDFKVAMNTVVWNNGLDLAPEFLYELVERGL